MHRLHGRKSLSRRLPLLISGLLIAALAAFAFVGYQQLTGALVVRTKDRLGKAVQLLAKSVESNVPQLRADMDKTAADSAIRRVIRTNDASTRAAAERVLAENISKIPQAIAFELSDRKGKRLLWIAGPAAKKSDSLRRIWSRRPKGRWSARRRRSRCALLRSRRPHCDVGR